MSLERFEVKRNIIHPLLAISFINFVLTVVMLVMSTTIFATPSGVAVKLSDSQRSHKSIGTTGGNCHYQ